MAKVLEDKPWVITPGFKSQDPMILKIKHASIHPEVLASISLIWHATRELAGVPTSNNLIEKIYWKSPQKLLYYLAVDVDSQD